MLQFDEIIETPARLRQILTGNPGKAALKEIDHIDSHCRRFIAASPFLIIATRGSNGLLDLSPKGDPAGFVAVLDDHTLAIPDRPGNNRLDSFENVLANGEVGLIFLIPGIGYTLRVSGRGRLVRDRALQDRLTVRGKQPHMILVVEVRRAFTHCAKCMTRSKLWQPDGWPDLADVPGLAETLVAHTGADMSRKAWDDLIEESERSGLY